MSSKPKTTPTNMREALVRLRRFPRVDLYLFLFGDGKPSRVSALWLGRNCKGLQFTIFNGPAKMIGCAFTLTLDGGDSEHETSIEWTDRGFITRRHTSMIELVFRSQRPWGDQGGIPA